MTEERPIGTPKMPPRDLTEDQKKAIGRLVRRKARRIRQGRLTRPAQTLAKMDPNYPSDKSKAKAHNPDRRRVDPRTGKPLKRVLGRRKRNKLAKQMARSSDDAGGVRDEPAADNPPSSEHDQSGSP